MDEITTNPHPFYLFSLFICWVYKKGWNVVELRPISSLLKCNMCLKPTALKDSGFEY